LLKKLNELKQAYIKSFGLKVIKEYSNDVDNSINQIKDNLKKLENKIDMIDYLIYTLNENYKNNKIFELLNCPNNKLIDDNTSIQMNYCLNNADNADNTENIEYIDIDQSLFVTSEEYSENNMSYSENVELTLSINNKSPFIAEYSN